MDSKKNTTPKLMQVQETHKIGLDGVNNDPKLGSQEGSEYWNSWGGG